MWLGGSLGWDTFSSFLTMRNTGGSSLEFFFGKGGLPVDHVTSDQSRISFPRCQFSIFINYIKELRIHSFFFTTLQLCLVVFFSSYFFSFFLPTYTFLFLHHTLHTSSFTAFCRAFELLTSNISKIL